MTLSVASLSLSLTLTLSFISAQITLSLSRCSSHRFVPIIAPPIYSQSCDKFEDSASSVKRDVSLDTWRWEWATSGGDEAWWIRVREGNFSDFVERERERERDGDDISGGAGG